MNTFSEGIRMGIALGWVSMFAVCLVLVATVVPKENTQMVYKFCGACSEQDLGKVCHEEYVCSKGGWK